ncbi:hypothetical protein OROMI_007130 [Orobanche minor]
MTRRPKNMKASSNRRSIIESVPNEVLVCEILGRVAASSFTDMFNVKLSCKTFKEIGEDKYVYQRVTLDKFPIIPWNPLSEKHEAFLNKCRESENPEVLYRQAVIDYFNKINPGSAWMHLQKAAKLGHVGARYVMCIVLLLCGRDRQKKIGINMLSDFRKSKSAMRRLKSCRNNLIKILRQMWVKNPDLIEPTKCCPTPNQHQWRNLWCEDDECSKCDACNADREIKYISPTFNFTTEV